MVDKINIEPYHKIVIDKDNKAEIRLYNGDEDTNISNKKRIGVYLFVNEECIASEWIDCGKWVKNTLVNDPKMTKSAKEKKVNYAIENMKIVWNHMNVKWDDLCE
jgi:hypothetical protein